MQEIEDKILEALKELERWEARKDKVRFRLEKLLDIFKGL